MLKRLKSKSMRLGRFKKITAPSYFQRDNQAVDNVVDGPIDYEEPSVWFDKTSLVEYFQHKYPGKVYKVIVPMDLCALDDLVTELVKVRDDISKLIVKIESRVSTIEIEDGEIGEDSSAGLWNRARSLWRTVRNYWDEIISELGFTDEERLRKLQELRADLETEMAAYKEGRAKGAGVAFVVFKDVYATNKAVQDFRNEKRRRIGKFFSVMELQLQRNQWKVERAPLATDIYWNHLGSSKVSLKLRRVFVNTCLVLMLLFFSSPLAVISAIKSAGRIINAEAMDNAQMWLAWVQSSSWLATIIFQFLPNVLIFVSMYIVIPSALSYLSKFERHLTVSGEQRAALLKMVCFFLVNLILLRALVESSLESAILRMGRCYLDGEDCKKIEQYMSASFLSRSCLSSLAFLITCTFLGISFDLLAPIPWIKKKLQKFQKNDMLLLVPEQSEDYPLENPDLESLRRPLIPEEAFDTMVGNNGLPNGATLSEIDLPGQVLSEYPISRTSPMPKQTFDFAQYYAFNLTIFALTMIYSAFAPIVVPVGTIYFGYRYVVDKYNFLFVYRVQGFPSGNDGRLMDTVLGIMRFCVDLFLLSMLLFFTVKGDSTKLQAIFTLGLFVLYKLLPSDDDNSQPALLQGIQTVDNVVDGPIDYEVFSQPKFGWDTSSPLLWIHFLFVVIVVVLVHFGINEIEQRLRITRFRDGYGNPSDPSANSSAIFTIMVHGVPKTLGFDKTSLVEYFQHKYPGKVYKVIVPMDLCALDDLVTELVKVRDDISKLIVKIESRVSTIEIEDGEIGEDSSAGLWNRARSLWRTVRNYWDEIISELGFTDEERLRKLQELRADLETEMAAYKEGRAKGAGVAFVVFKDVYATNKAVQDFRNEKRRRIGKFFSVMELQLQRNQWKVERAPLATDIYWNHLGSSKVSLKLRRVFVNTCLVLMLLFFSSPLAVISAIKSAGRIINAEAMDNAQMWLAWVQSSSWLATIIFQFLPNVLIFVSMYIVIPSALSYLSKFERHLTVSGEQRAALLKMVCFFLVNLILLRALVESSLESAILRMGRCYLDGEDCKKIEQYMSASFLSRSCLSSLAFLITCTFLGISFDLLAPIPWIKKKLQKFQKNDMLLLVPEQSEDYPLENPDLESLRRPLIPEEAFDTMVGNNGLPNGATLSEIDLPGQVLSEYPISRTSPMPKQTFDFAQYYAFNLTIFALTMIYSAFAPIVVPVGTIYFGYRYVVDKYNFLFVYRVQGFPSGNDGRLMDTVLGIMRFCVDLFLLSMLLFFTVKGDSTKLQAIFTLGLFVLYKLLPSDDDNSQPALLQGIQTVDNVVDGPIDYEVFSQPKFGWDTSSPLLWIHFLFVVIVVVLVHFGINEIEQRLRITRFRDGYGNPSDPSANSSAIFTIMVHGVPKTLGFDKTSLVEYFQHKYPGKVYKVIVPMDLCALDDLVTELVKVRDDISKLIVKIESRVSTIEIEDGEIGEDSSAGLWNRARSLWRTVRNYWDEIISELGFTDEERLRKLQELRADLETEMAAYKEGRAKGAGVAFVVFKDVYATNKAVQDFRNEKRRRIGKFFSVMELQLQRNQWKVERAPLATDIYWNHLGSSKVSLKLRRVFVNTCLVLMLLFFSSPLAVISAIKSAGRIINAEAMDNAQMWLAWVQSSSWLATIIFQFLPNVLIFVSMYIVIPSALSYLSKFERHLTVSGEQRAALLKMVCFFLVNLILLRALVESSLESAILRMGRCYLDGEDCKKIEQYMSASFLSRSCLSSLAFLITCTFLGISFDLLAPIPWIKKKLQKFQKNDMLLLVPEQSEDYPLENPDLESLRRPLIPEEAFDTMVGNNGLPNGATLSEIDLPGQVLSEYPISRTSPMPKQTFDFAQYYAFNLTIFALTMIYSAFAPIVVPVGTIYFGYRYVVDKYNFLFVYRVQGFPSGNDGRLMDTVLGIMRFCVDLFLLSMLLFFTVKGDSTKLQAIFTLGLFVLYKLLPSDDDNSQPALLQGIQTVDNVVDGPIDYEVFSQPKFGWDTSSPLLWIHFLFVVIVVVLVHFGINEIEQRLRITRFRDGYGNPSDPSANSSAIFTIMVHGVPKTLGFDKTSLVEYFQHKYPGKVYKVIVPMDLCALDDLVTELVKVRDDISKLIVKIESRVSTIEIEDGEIGEDSSAGLWNRARSLWRTVRNYWDEIISELGFTDEERLRKLQELRADLETEMAAYKEGRAKGAGVAFVVFKDVYATNKAVQDFRNEKRRRIGKFFSVMELQLQRNQWKVERAPLATDIYWNHLGSSKVSLKLRRVFVNTCLVLMLLFFSSPLAVISAIKSAGRIINAEAMDNAQMWLAWVQSSSWLATIIFQFLPNVLIFVSMYIVIPSALSYLSKFERHLTVSGEQRAALLKMVCFFLVNLILLRALVESSLESAILRMGRCYLDGEDCKKIEQYMSASFLSRSCLSSLAFLITCTFLGISFDLLAPIPWIKKKLQKFQKNDMLLLVPEQSEDYPLENPDLESLRRPLIPEEAFDTMVGNNGLPNGATLSEIDLPGQVLSEYPISRTSPMPKQTFDFAQYYAFNLTIFALTMIYSAFAPIVVPVGTIYFGYRYVVDKYNFLFVYRVQGFPSGNDGRLMDTVLGIMRFCVDLFLLSMLLFFTVKGDSTKLQAIFTLGLFVLYKLLPSDDDNSQPALLQGIQTVDNVVDGPIDYEVFSQPKFGWDTSSPLLWIHFLFVVIVVVLVHFGINEIEQRLRITRFRDGYGNPSDPSANSSAIFTIMVHGVPKTLGFDKTSLVEYFQHKYPGKVYKVIVPMDLCALDDLVTELVKVRDDISKLIVKIESRVSTIEIEDGEIGEDSSAGLWNRARSLWRTVRNYWDEIISELGFTDEERLRKLQELRADLETEMAAYKEGRAKGAGVAFVLETLAQLALSLGIKRVIATLVAIELVQ
ncbi:hypothetical protein TEA_003524 [Camellia sinensis var. sinensis]|uniref:Uncharacterized protein n=1 Tax=Camellia sinensis var. sinensis TaxID=542762 RepID=A0A4S4DP79_CAMSN|nr:hypothetical protein TEA_003524 [Camellia sinensis var. sinensis]